MLLPWRDAPTYTSAAHAELTGTNHSVAQGLNAVVLRSLRSATLGLALLYVLFVIGHLLLLPAPARWIMAALAGTSIVLLLVIHWLLGRGAIPTIRAHPLAIGVIGLVLGNSTAHVLVTSGIEHTTNIALLFIGIGGIVLTWRSFIAALLLSLVVWCLAIWQLPDLGQLAHYGYMLVGAAILSGLIFITRRRTYLAFEQLRLLEADQRATLEGLLAQQHQQGLDVQHARDLAVKASAAKTEFMQLVAHELRTPLTAILGNAHLVTLLGNVTPPQLQALDATSDSVQHMVTLIDELTDLTRLESGDLQLETTILPFEQVVESAILQLRAQTLAKQQTLNIVLGDGLLVHGDYLRLFQIVTNLLSNASKYTPVSGALMVSADHTADQRHVRLVVSDTGIGIDPSEQQQLFQKFYRTARSLHYASGTGLGLYLVRQLVEQHGGTIVCESTVGAGTSFVVEFPAA
jgi:signal transduction histidine kinase